MNSKGNKSLRIEVVELTKTSPQTLEILFNDLNNSLKDEVDTDNTQELKKLLLEGIWVQNRISKHSIIHLINPLFDKNTSTYIVNNSQGFAVIEPDNLLTCTLVASSLFCERKTWLNSVFSGQAGTNRAMLVGTLVHEVFQYGVKNKIADIDKLTVYLDDLLNDASVMLEIYSVELHLKDIRSEAITYISSVKEWIEKFMLSGPRYPLTNDSELEVKVIGINDIEENVWSTKYGLKGKIDVTGSVRIYDKRTKTVSDRIIPLELKTGNPNLSSSHAAQVSLYSMMIEDRYSETNQGLVIYLKNHAAMHNVALTHNIKRDLIQRRNQINYHMKNYFRGPEMIDQLRMCSGCERITECILISDIYSPGEIDHYTTMKSLEPEAIGHLDRKFKLFFQRYHEKLVAQMIPQVKQQTNICETRQNTGSFWTYSSEEAELRGTGFGGLQVSSSKIVTSTNVVIFKRHPDYLQFNKPHGKHDIIEVEEDDEPEQVTKKMKINDYFRPVKRSQNSPDSPVKIKNNKPFNTKLDFNRCRVAVSLDNSLNSMDDQNSSTAIAMGFINEIKEDHIVLRLLEGTLDVSKTNLIYRIDKLEKKSQIEVERAVLVRLLAREDWRCDRVRQLLLEPDFKSKENVRLNLFILSTGFDEITELSAKQQKFAIDAVSCENYCILTEKIEPKKSNIHKIISVIASIVTKLEKTLLITAQNIDDLVDLMKILQQQKLKFILIDDGKSVKARYLFAANLVKVPQVTNLNLCKKFDAYIRQHEMATIVITTYAMSIGGLLFTRKTYDYCVAYDCDTTELLTSLSPMFSSDKHIIIDVRETSDDKERPGYFDSLGHHLRSQLVEETFH